MVTYSHCLGHALAEKFMAANTRCMKSEDRNLMIVSDRDEQMMRAKKDTNTKKLTKSKRDKKL
jgi:hypothetical protein